MIEWLQDYRYFVLIVCLCGFAYAGRLYWRAYTTPPARTRAKGGRRRRAGAPLKLAPTPAGSGPAPRQSSVQGEQEDLLASLDDRSTLGDTAHFEKAFAPTAVVSAQPGASGTLNQESDSEAISDRLDQILGGDDDDSAADPNSDSAAISTTDKWRTTRQMAATHPASGIDPAISEATQDLDNQATADRPQLSPAELYELSMRKASRMEELGLHIGIEATHVAALDPADRHANDAIAADLDEAQRARLSSLGLTSSGDEDHDRQQRLVTEQLDHILDRLDNALGDTDETHDHAAAADEATDARSAAPTQEAPDDVEPAPSDAPASPDADGAQSGQPETDEPQADPSETDEPKADDAPAQATTSLLSDDDLPAWARADTFDDDLPDDKQGPQQQSLFD